MKKIGILNCDISNVIASMGHGDLIVIADAGLPIPSSTKRIDLALEKNLPTFLDTVRVILKELQVEDALIASEMREKNPEVREKLFALLGDVPIREIPHEEFKKMTQNAKAVVRTGEFTPYANVILKGGVVF
jgi:D-ribose pyranase